MFIFAWGVQIVVDVEWLILRPAEVVMVSKKFGVMWGWSRNPSKEEKNLNVSDPLIK